MAEKDLNKQINTEISKRFFYNRVISRNIITDWVQSIRNILGLELIAYTKAIKDNTEEMMRSIEGMKVKWYRIDIEQFTNASIMINLYGELE